MLCKLIAQYQYSKCVHRNILALMGYCVVIGKVLCLVTEYIPNGKLLMFLMDVTTAYERISFLLVAMEALRNN